MYQLDIVTLATLSTKDSITAQNIQAVFPTLVDEDNNGYLQTAYGTYDAMTVEAIRVLNDKNIALQKRVDELEKLLKKVNELEARMAEMKSQTR